MKHLKKECKLARTLKNFDNIKKYCKIIQRNKNKNFRKFLEIFKNFMILKAKVKQLFFNIFFLSLNLFSLRHKMFSQFRKKNPTGWTKIAILLTHPTF